MNDPTRQLRIAPVPTATHCPYCSLQCGILMVAGDRPATLQARVVRALPVLRRCLESKGAAP